MPRDLFLDEISEVPNENDEEFGLDRLEPLLRKKSAQPFPQLWELIMSEVERHGVQQDDQTLPLLRVRTQQASVARAIASHTARFD